MDKKFFPSKFTEETMIQIVNEAILEIEKATPQFKPGFLGFERLEPLRDDIRTNTWSFWIWFKSTDFKRRITIHEAADSTRNSIRQNLIDEITSKIPEWNKESAGVF